MKKIITYFTFLIILIYINTSAKEFSFEKLTPKFNNGKFILDSQIFLLKQPTSILNQIWENSTWNDESREIFTYNNSGFMTKVTSDSLINGQWVTYGQVEITYDLNNNVLQFQSISYNKGNIEYGIKVEYHYVEGKVSETIGSTWNMDNSNWELSKKEVYEYTNGNAAKILGFDWDIATSSWLPTEENTITYDNQNREVESLSKMWDPDAGEFKNYNLTTTEYNANGKISRELSKSWDENSQNWSETNYFLYEYEYDNNANLITMISTISMDFSGFSFKFKDKSESEYDSNNFLVKETEYNWDTFASTWNAISQSQFKNDSEGNFLEIIAQNNDPVEGWINAEKQIYNYDPAVDVKNESELPMEFNLSQNYPNPFNPVTVINYKIDRTDFVQLNIYDVLGNFITSLVNEIKSPGTYSAIFDATNLSSGTYIYTLRSGNKQISRRSLLIK